MPLKVTATLLILGLLVGPLGPLAHAEPSGDDSGTIAATAAANVFYVPGKLITCQLGIGFGVLATLLTFGSVYSDTMEFMAKACGGKWWVETNDIPSPPRPSSVASYEGRVTTSTDCIDAAGQASARVGESDKTRVFGEHYDACRAAKTLLRTSLSTPRTTGP
jgi:hypothetical protein